MIVPSPKPFPKKPDGKIDKIRVFQLYYNGPHFRWNDFCRTHGFNANQRSDFPIKEWQQRWLSKRISEQEEMLAEEGLDLQRELYGSRAEAIRSHIRIQAKLRNLFEEHLNQAMPTGGKDLLALATAARILYDCDSRALFMDPKKVSFNAVIDAQQRHSDGEGWTEPVITPLDKLINDLSGASPAID